MKLVIVGTDRRLSFAAQRLRQKGITVDSYFHTKDCLASADAVLLPFPVSRDGITLNAPGETAIPLTELQAALPPSALIMGGAWPDMPIVDLTKRDDFALLNAIPTAEGALSLAIENTDLSLFDSKILVTGFGRVARILVDRLAGLCPHVTVAARKSSDRAEITALGLCAVSTDELSKIIGDCDLAFNTVPYPLFTDDVLKKANRQTLFIELASQDAGFTKCNQQNIRLLCAPGLPGKTACRSAGYALADTVLTVLRDHHID